MKEIIQYFNEVCNELLKVSENLYEIDKFAEYIEELKKH